MLASGCPEDRTISSPTNAGVWRMVSEDSDEFLAGFTVIHGLRDFRNFHKTLPGLVFITAHQCYALSKFLEILLLR